MKSITKFIIGILKKNKKDVIIISLIATLSSLLSVAVPYIYGRLFDLSIIPNTQLTLLLSLIFIWLIASLISNFTSKQRNSSWRNSWCKDCMDKRSRSIWTFLDIANSIS